MKVERIRIVVDKTVPGWLLKLTGPERSRIIKILQEGCDSLSAFSHHDRKAMMTGRQAIILLRKRK